MIILNRRALPPRRHTYRPRRIVQETCYVCRGNKTVSVACRDNELGAALETCVACRGRGYILTERA